MRRALRGEVIGTCGWNERFDVHADGLLEINEALYIGLAEKRLGLGEGVLDWV